MGIKKLAYGAILLSAAMLLLPSCGVLKGFRGPSANAKDSTRVEIHTAYIERVDTIFVRIPYEVVRNVTLDTLSVIETSVAKSEALVTAGTLHHSMITKYEEPLPVPVTVKTEVRDSIIYRDREVKVEVPVVTEKELTLWQEVKMKWWWIPWLIVLFAYRKTIIKIVGKLFV